VYVSIGLAAISIPPVLDLSASFWHQSVVERTTKRTTRSTTSAAVPTGREGSRWIPKEWTVAEFAPIQKLTAFLTLIDVFFFLGRKLFVFGGCHCPFTASDPIR
jgi:hypothetical protein